MNAQNQTPNASSIPDPFEGPLESPFLDDSDFVAGVTSGDDNGDGSDHLRYLLTAYLFGDISAAGKREVEEHLAVCDACRAELEEMRETSGMIDEALKNDPLEYSFDKRRRERVLASGQQRRFRLITRLVTNKPLMAAASLMFLTLVAGYWMFQVSVASRSRVASSPDLGDYSALMEAAVESEVVDVASARATRSMPESEKATEGDRGEVLWFTHEDGAQESPDFSPASTFPGTGGSGGGGSLEHTVRGSFQLSPPTNATNAEEPMVIARADDIAAADSAQDLIEALSDVSGNSEFDAFAGSGGGGGSLHIVPNGSITIGQSVRTENGRRSVAKAQRHRQRPNQQSAGAQVAQPPSPASPSKKKTKTRALHGRSSRLGIAPEDKAAAESAPAERSGGPDYTFGFNFPSTSIFVAQKESAEPADHDATALTEVVEGPEGFTMGFNVQTGDKRDAQIARDQVAEARRDQPEGSGVDNLKNLRGQERKSIRREEQRMANKRARIRELTRESGQAVPKKPATEERLSESLKQQTQRGYELKRQLEDGFAAGLEVSEKNEAGKAQANQPSREHEFASRGDLVVGDQDESFADFDDEEPEGEYEKLPFGPDLEAPPLALDEIPALDGRLTYRMKAKNVDGDDDQLGQSRMHLFADAEALKDIIGAENLLRSYNVYQQNDANLNYWEFKANRLNVPAPEVGDEGLGREEFRRRYGVNPFMDTRRDKVSTFAMDVDTASFTRAKMQLGQSQLPPPSSVRVEEFVNYFPQEYATHPEEVFSVTCDGMPSVFGNDGVELLRVGIKARDLRPNERRNAVLTFAVDISGSMSDLARLETVKQSIGILVDALESTDLVSIATYADEATLILPHTPARQKERIRGVLGSILPRGGTNVEAGLDLAYRVAHDALSPGSLNRVILVSDGVANVGARGPEEILKKVKVFARKGIYLSTVGVGMGKYNDAMLERLANEGNGNYSYVSNVAEATRIFRHNLPGTLEVLAQDAKIQVEFHPEGVARYRLLGYENRDIADNDFRNDKIDAGEVGPGTTVTALYEIVRRPGWTGSIGTVRLRYRDTRTGQVDERDFPIPQGVVAAEASVARPSLRLLACAAELAELLRDSYYARDGSYSHVLEEIAKLDHQTHVRPETQELHAMAAQAQVLKVQSLQQWLQQLPAAQLQNLSEK